MFSYISILEKYCAHKKVMSAIVLRIKSIKTSLFHFDFKYLSSVKKILLEFKANPLHTE